jgi:hypothetical protein
MLRNGRRSSKVHGMFIVEAVVRWLAVSRNRKLTLCRGSGDGGNF